MKILPSEMNSLPLIPIYSKKREKFLYLYVTTRCGLRCKHCYVGNERLNQGTDMTLKQAIKIMDYFKITGGHDKLYILGGEPTINPDLPKIVDAACSRGYTVTISSNGDFEEDLLDEITPDILASWNFSLESANPKVHRIIRGNPRNYTQVTSRIKNAIERGHQVRLMCTVSKTNVNEALDLIPFANELGATTLSFHNLGLTGNAARFLKPLSPSEWMNFCTTIEEHAQDSTTAIYYPPTFVHISEQEKWSDRGYPGCPARSFDRPHVYPDGTVYSCPLLMDGQRYYAKFNESDGLELNTNTNNEMNAYLSLDSTCLGCSATSTCGGGCPAYSTMTGYSDEYKCDRNITPLCILWTTYAGSTQPTETVHNYR